MNATSFETAPSHSRPAFSFLLRISFTFDFQLKILMEFDIEIILFEFLFCGVRKLVWGLHKIVVLVPCA